MRAAEDLSSRRHGGPPAKRDRQAAVGLVPLGEKPHPMYKLGPKVKRLLSYTAPAVMTAMWLPIVFLGHQESSNDFITSPFLIAGVATVIFSLKIKNTLAVVMFGMSVFASLKVLF